MITYLSIGGRDTLDFGVRISGENTFESPRRSVEEVSVPGRSGNLILDNGCFENIEVKYPAFIAENFKENMRAFRNFLSSLRGYQRLEDTYHPEYYRMACFSDALSPKMLPLNVAGTFDLVFNCKPQRWLKTGEEKKADISSIYNPTLFNAKPMIRLYGTGALVIGDYTLVVDNLYPKAYIDIDCDLMNAYWEGTNYNRYVSGAFPELVPGDNAISWAGSSFEIIPRWWEV